MYNLAIFFGKVLYSTMIYIVKYVPHELDKYFYQINKIICLFSISGF